MCWETIEDRLWSDRKRWGAPVLQLTKEKDISVNDLGARAWSNQLRDWLKY